MNSTITPMEPLLAVDWEKVSHVRVTLEKPTRSGGLRWRQGTSEAKKNLSYNAHDPDSGGPYWPGAPIMYPEDAPAIAGDPDRDSFIMPVEACFTAFGYFYAPKTVPRNGIVGFTQTEERNRVAAFWHWFKMPPGDGTMNPPMNRIAAPDVPHVAIRPLSKSMLPVKDEAGNEIVIRPFEFWKFDDAALYDALPAAKEHEVAQMLSGFTAEEIDAIRDLVRKGKPANGKA
ncbi:MAG: hypothetical protein WAN50_03390 [Minisyncoccia bacterium]